jgi:hypothetical protein
VAQWSKGDFYLMEFSQFQPDLEKNYGSYYNIIIGSLVSPPFQIYKNVIEHSTMSSVAYYFKSQRATGEWEAFDKSIGFRGPRQGSVDAHGGWFDATGDVGIHMTHQSHTTYFNPQQASFSAYALYKVMDLLKESSNEYLGIFIRRLLDEASYGADWLMRARAPSTSFYKSGPGRKNAYEPVSKNRAIGFEYKKSSAQFGKATTASEEEITDEYYETSFRSGGGYAIAALAAASRYPYPSCEHSGYEYLDAARASFLHLEEFNEKYTNDGAWNLLDEFCALEAAVELYKASNEMGFLFRARDLADKVMAHYIPVSDDSGYFSVNETDRPFFSATDEGTPVIALLNFLQIEKDPDRKAKILDLSEKAMRFKLSLTSEVSNPFGYARLFYEDKDGKRGHQFFFPHNTEMAPWWQGDNARILSLSTAARLVASLTKDTLLAKKLEVFAEDQIAWVLGLNPFDSCMLEGAGRHSIDYFFKRRFDFISAPGGIVNGITSGIDNEEGIDFLMDPDERPDIDDNWRWAEQWLPHASWYLYAIAMKKV